MSIVTHNVEMRVFIHVVEDRKNRAVEEYAQASYDAEEQDDEPFVPYDEWLRKVWSITDA